MFPVEHLGGQCCPGNSLANQRDRRWSIHVPAAEPPSSDVLPVNTVVEDSYPESRELPFRTIVEKPRKTMGLEI